MSKSWSSVSSVDTEKDWSSVYTNHGTPSDSLEGTPSDSLEGTPSGSDNDDLMQPAGDDIDKLNENRRRLVDVGFERGIGAGGGKRKRNTRGKKRKTRKSRKSRKSSRRRRR